MPVNEKILWTALPSGMSGSSLKLSVFVSPRIGFTGPSPGGIYLDECPAFSGWTKTMKDNIEKGSFSLDALFSNYPEAVTGEFDPGWLDNLDPDLWSGIFSQDHRIPVTPFEFTDLSGSLIYSYPAEDIVSTIRDMYTTTAISVPQNIPAMSRLADTVPSLHRFINHVGMREGYNAFNRFNSLFMEKEKTINRSRFLEMLHNPDRKDTGMIEKMNFLLELFSKQFNGQNQTVFKYFDKNVCPEAIDFFLANRFYDRPKKHNKLNPPVPVPGVPRVRKPRPDFHQMVASLADHPVLLRKLGLVIDLVIRKAPGIPAGRSSVRIKPAAVWEEVSGRKADQELSPWTACHISKTRFSTRPRDLHFPEARIDLKSGVFKPVLVDSDGASLKMVNFSQNIRPLLTAAGSAMAGDPAKKSVSSVPDEQGLPSLRTAGIAFVEKERAQGLKDTAIRLKKINDDLAGPPGPAAGPDKVLYTEDLVRGFRVDVWDQNIKPPLRKWRSLCRRTVKYELSGILENPLGTIHDEGYIKAASTTSNPQEDEQNHYLHGALFRWDGWSLCARKPGKTIIPRAGKPDVARQWPADEDIDTDLPGGLNLRPEIAAEPGTLPVLRFNHSYRMRARNVNIAGDGEGCYAGNCDGFIEDWSRLDDETASDPVPFFRFEPVISPALVPRYPYTGGESAECMVIRSDYDKDVTAYISSLGNTVADTQNYRRICERHVVPPKTSQIMAEMHGMFDPYLALGLYQEAYDIAAKEEGTLDSPQSGDIEIITPPTLTEAKNNSYVIHREPLIRVPYLPDPLARGTAFRNLPGISLAWTPEPALPAPGTGPEAVRLPDSGDLVLKIPFRSDSGEGKTWADKFIPFRICLADAEGPSRDTASVTWKEIADTDEAQERVMTVRLPPGEMVRILYSSYPSAAGLSHLAIWHWITDGIQDRFLPPIRDKKMGDMREIATAGSHWMLTPYRELRLVHAVQHPLIAPEIQSILVYDRYEGKTQALFGTSTFRLSAKSTTKLDLFCTWTETIDDRQKENEEMPVLRPHADHVLEVKADNPAQDELTIGKSIADIDRTGWEGQHHHEFGDTRFRVVNYHLKATSRFREFFPDDFEEKEFTRDGPEFKPVIINSSARPPAPKVLYIIPTFQWGPVTEDMVFQMGTGDWYGAGDPHMHKRLARTRYGRGLRVYLDRPWFVSGAGEQLGVVLFNDDKTGTVPDVLKPFVTQCGMDPVWFSGSISPVLTPDNFPLAVEKDTIHPRLVLDDRKVSVAGHQVGYDKERNLWYCDIEIQPGDTYFPFVRLALARYQPHSVYGCHISEVVLADFAQLAEDRTAAVSYDPSGTDPRNISISVSGVYPNFENRLTGDGLLCASCMIRVLVRVEMPDPSLPDAGRDPALGWIPASDPVWLKPVHIKGSTVAWTGNLPLPQTSKPRRFRIAIEEYEYYEGDRFSAVHYTAMVRMKEPRLVYSDILDLPPEA